MNKTPVEALVLSGNGAYGAYEVGVALALFSGQSSGVGFKPSRPLILSGASVGGLNAALLATVYQGDFVAAGRELEQIWLRRIARSSGDCNGGAIRVRGSGLLNPECLVERPLKALAQISRDTAYLASRFIQQAAEIAKTDTSLEHRLADSLDVGLFISPEPLRALIRETISLPKLRHTQIRLRVAATNWRTGQPRVFINSDFTDQSGHAMLQASTAVPGIFPAVDIAGEPYVDGGIFMNTPLKPAIDAGADVLHVIYMEPDVSNMELGKFQSTIEVILRTRNIANGAIIATDLQTARRENASLRLLDSLHRGQWPGARDMADFARGAAHVREHILKSKLPRLLTIHCYHPRRMLEGKYGIANFDSGAIRQMVERGFADARNHDCSSSGCVIPGG